MLFQVLAPIESAMPSLPTVTIRESLDARYSIYYKDQHLPAKLMPARMLAVPRAIKPLRNLTPVAPHLTAPPPPSHPWRKYPAVTKSLNTYRT